MIATAILPWTHVLAGTNVLNDYIELTDIMIPSICHY